MGSLIVLSVWMIGAFATWIVLIFKDRHMSEYDFKTEMPSRVTFSCAWFVVVPIMLLIMMVDWLIRRIRAIP